jgi:hypothetical protein
MKIVQYNSAVADIGALNDECVLLTDLFSQLSYLQLQVLCSFCIVIFFVFQYFT